MSLRPRSPLFQVRCPRCNRLACEAAPGSLLRVKCGRCGELFERTVTPAL
jgi:phage FluMu protein Com